MTSSVEIGERLREERERLGFTQAAFADEIDVSRTTQFNYEAGTRVPDAMYLAAAAVRNLDVAYVVTGARGMQPSEKLTSKARGLLLAYNAADEDVRDAIFTLATKAAGAGGDVATPRKRRSGAVFHGPVGSFQEVGNVTGHVGNIGGGTVIMGGTNVTVGKRSED
jgi:transcriptional regulator with XRE-family HTH domain